MNSECFKKSIQNNEVSARIAYIVSLLKLKLGDKVLNIGISNIPELEIFLENKVKECVTIDIDKEKLRHANTFLKKTKLIEGDILKEPAFKNNYFDKVIILEVLEHLEDDIKAANWINSVMKKGGTLIVAVPNTHPLHYLNPVKYLEHKRHYTNESITKLLIEQGFKIDNLNVVENWTLLANLYIHLFFKFILKRTIPFGILKKSSEKTYSQKNYKGLDIIVKATKISDISSAIINKIPKTIQSN